MRTHRLFVGDLADAATQHQLTPEQSHYVCRVLRAVPGTQVELMLGNGRAVRAVVEAADKRACLLNLGERVTVAAPQVELRVVLAWLKADAMDRAVQKSVELGATHIHLFHARLGNIGLSGERERKRVSHLQRIVEASSAQCAQYFPPELRSFKSLADYLQNLGGNLQIIGLHPQAPILDNAEFRNTALFIGPEGGWHDGELELLHQHGGTTSGLGSLVLRAETAPVAGLSAVRTLWGWGRR